MDSSEVDAFITEIYGSLGPTDTHADLLEATRLARLSLTREQLERMAPEFKRRQAVNQSVEFPSVD